MLDPDDDVVVGLESVDVAEVELPFDDARDELLLKELEIFDRSSTRRSSSRPRPRQSPPRSRRQRSRLSLSERESRL
jgi:hypothetical protein